MKIEITEFAQRHFKKDFSGTKISDKVDRVQFLELINLFASIQTESSENTSEDHPDWFDGYAPFCKLLRIPNSVGCKVGSLEITIENYQYLRSGYSSRNESELPVMSRWFELPLKAPVAKFLYLVLYDRQQLEKEHNVENSESFETLYSKDMEYGIVAFLAENSTYPPPVPPVTMMRNALGVSEGGSGHPLDREEYLKSVEYWSRYANVK